MSDSPLPHSEETDPRGSCNQAPNGDAVFALVSDLGQLLLNWSWEGTEGLTNKIKRAPAYVFMITPFFTLTPGSHGLRGFESLIGGQPIVGVEDFATLFATLLAIALGILIGGLGDTEMGQMVNRHGNLCDRIR